MSDLIAWNEIKDNTIHPGQKIIVTKPKVNVTSTPVSTPKQEITVTPPISSEKIKIETPNSKPDGIQREEIPISNSKPLITTQPSSEKNGVEVIAAIAVNNMSEFFETDFGSQLKSKVKKTNKMYQGQSVYEVTEKLSVGLKKGDQIYLDNLHKDHLEVFDKFGNFTIALNLDGTLNPDKTQKGQGRKLK